MENNIDKISKKFGRKTILLPENLSADCYAIYSKKEFESVEEKLLVENKAYKHRLYFYKKTGNNSSNKVLSFIFLTAGEINHKDPNPIVDMCVNLAKNDYSAIEILSVFTLRTLDTIDAISEDSILDVSRIDFSKNDIVLAYGDKILPTSKYENISEQDLEKINKVMFIKINQLMEILSDKSQKIFKLSNDKLELYNVV